MSVDQLDDKIQFAQQEYMANLKADIIRQTGFNCEECSSGRFNLFKLLDMYKKHIEQKGHLRVNDIAIIQVKTLQISCQHIGGSIESTIPDF